MASLRGSFFGRADDDDNPQFQVLQAPETKEIEVVAALLAERISKFLVRRGLGPRPPHPNRILWPKHPAFCQIPRVFQTCRRSLRPKIRLSRLGMRGTTHGRS